MQDWRVLLFAAQIQFFQLNLPTVSLCLVVKWILNPLGGFSPWTTANNLTKGLAGGDCSQHPAILSAPVRRGALGTPRTLVAGQLSNSGCICCIPIGNHTLPNVWFPNHPETGWVPSILTDSHQAMGSMGRGAGLDPLGTGTRRWSLAPTTPHQCGS